MLSSPPPLSLIKSLPYLYQNNAHMNKRPLSTVMYAILPYHTPVFTLLHNLYPIYATLEWQAATMDAARQKLSYRDTFPPPQKKMERERVRVVTAA